MIRCALAALALCLLAPDALAGGEADPAETPAWLDRLENGPPDLRVTDPLGRRFTRRASVGIALIPAGVAVQAGAVAFGAASRRSGLLAAGVLGGGAVPFGGAAGAAIALERAHVHLRLKGVHVSPTAGRVGHALAGAGALGMVATVPLGDNEWGQGLYYGATALILLSAIPYAIQAGQVRRAYASLPAASEPEGLIIRPVIDPVTRTVGVTGTF